MRRTTCSLLRLGIPTRLANVAKSVSMTPCCNAATDRVLLRVLRGKRCAMVETNGVLRCAHEDLEQLGNAHTQYLVWQFGQPASLTVLKL